MIRHSSVETDSQNIFPTRRPARLLRLLVLLGSPLVLMAESPSPSSPEVAGETLSLRQAVRLATLHSPELKAVSWNTEGALARVRQARLWPNPEIEFERENFGETGRFSGLDEAEDTLGISQLLPLGRDLKYARRIAEAEHEQSTWDYHAARLEVVLEATRQYIETLAAEGRMQLAERELQLARQLESITLKRVESGDASPVEISRVTVPVVSAEIKHTRAGLALKASRQRLALLLGESGPYMGQLTGNLESIAGLPSPEGLTGLINNSPVVGRWAAEISGRKAGRQLARAESIPDPTLRFGIKRDRATGDEGLIVGISLPLPIFDRNQGAVSAARSAERAAHEERRAAGLRLERALSRQYFNLSASQAEATALRDRVLPAARRAYDATLKAFREGELPYLDVMDAARSLLEYEELYLEVLVDCHTANAELDALLGGGLDQTDL
ncbi:MAG: TolC family protein [Opitutales bacterium]|jgi:cobalt-zinc-cadmium efflux system outer membrane protein